MNILLALPQPALQRTTVPAFTQRPTARTAVASGRVMSCYVPHKLPPSAAGASTLRALRPQWLPRIPARASGAGGGRGPNCLTGLQAFDTAVTRQATPGVPLIAPFAAALSPPNTRRGGGVISPFTARTPVACRRRTAVLAKASAHASAGSRPAGFRVIAPPRRCACRASAISRHYKRECAMRGEN